jgi:hypothetical protein
MVMQFLCTTECPAPASMKQVLVSTTDGASSTIKYVLFISHFYFFELFLSKFEFPRCFITFPSRSLLQLSLLRIAILALHLTKFIQTHESLDRSNIPDVVQNYGFWAPTYNGRAIVGPVYQDHLAGVAMDELITKYKQSMAEGDKEGRAIVWA